MGMNQEQKDLKNGLNAHITLPECVEERMQEAYQSIRKDISGSQGKVVAKRHRINKWVAAAAVAVLTCTTTLGVLAATGFFSKEVIEKENAVTYKFSVDYELVPGEFEAVPTYLPEGYMEQEENKYCGEDNWGHGISVFPVYSTAELEKINNTINVRGAGNIEETTLAGMEANIITYPEEEKNRSPKYIFLFNPQEGYVIQIWGDYEVPMEELKKFADGLQITRISDAAYETEEEKAARLKEKELDQQVMDDLEQKRAVRLEKGVRKEEIIGIGKTAKVEITDGSGERYISEEFTVTDAQFADRVSEYDSSGFYDYSEVEPWLNEDGTLKPYIRELLDEEGNSISEEQVNQQFLIIKAKVKKCALDESGEDTSEASKDTGINANLVRMIEREDGSYTWATDCYQPRPDQENFLQTDNSAIYFDQAEFTDESNRNHFFFRTLDKGDELEYTLIFVVDEDMKDSLFLQFEAFPWTSGDIDSEPVFFSLK